MTPGAVRILDNWAATPGFRDLSVREAAAKLQEVLPRYPFPDDQPVKICVNGYRWFAEEMEAVADAIYRASRRPYLLDETLAGSEWDSDRNAEGLWSLPNRCALHLRAGGARKGAATGRRDDGAVYHPPGRSIVASRGI